MHEARRPRVGELRQRVSLGSEAVYRVCRVERRFVEVEVVRAPGLGAGQRFRFAPEAVAKMGVIANSPDVQGAPETGEFAQGDG